MNSDLSRVGFMTVYCMYVFYSAVKSIQKSEERFVSIQNYLKNALFLKQQLKYEEGRKKAGTKQKK